VYFIVDNCHLHLTNPGRLSQKVIVDIKLHTIWVGEIIGVV
jgi:hypothetical protein